MDNHNQVTLLHCLLFCCLFFLINTPVNSQEGTSSTVNITFIDDAVTKGAVCLDGSPGAYYLAQGFGDGVNSWIVNLQGGGWCTSTDECIYRTKQLSGSTKSLLIANKTFDSILSPKYEDNQGYYNWNRVFIRYCDGASFMADVEEVDPDTNLHLRGRRIFSTIMEELLSTKGMAEATNAILVGESAGGLATILNCDYFHSFLPNCARVKCISDSGFFIYGKDLPGANYREDYFANLTEFHELANFLPQSCTSRMAPGQCLFAENVVEDIQTPLFLLNSDYDQFQVSRNLKPNLPDDQGWKDCTFNYTTLENCTTSQLQLTKDFRSAFLQTIDGLNYEPCRGLFINSCYIHVFLLTNHTEQGTIPTLQNKTILQALDDWYFERREVQLIDTENEDPILCKV